ncbi:MAG TPA: hypothetical protein VNB94_00555 [Mycobacteriales bacterium]|nr:hypothetical protein [Mycobacteriales bacterium]
MRRTGGAVLAPRPLVRRPQGRGPRAALGVALLILGVCATSVGAVDACGTGRPRTDGWEQLAIPAGFGPDGIADYAASPDRPDLLLATDGASVARSIDGGCAWTLTLTRGGLMVAGVPLLVERVIDLHVAVSPGGRSRLYVLGEVAVGDLTRTGVLVSDDEGVTWQEGGVGLPVISQDATLTTSPLDVNLSLVSLVDAALRTQAVYASTDAGRSWSRRTPIVGADSTPPAILADPSDTSVVHGWGTSGVTTSRDGGRSFTASGAINGSVADLATSRRTTTGSRLVAADAETPALHRSDDGGVSWRTVVLPMTASSVDTLPLADVVVAAGEGEVVAAIRGVLFDVSPTGEAAQDVSISASAAGLRVLARSGPALLRRDLLPRGRVTSALPRIDLRAADVVDVVAPTLTPQNLALSLRPGEIRDVPYSLALPAAPTPLDVFFLVDTTGSMGPVIAGLRRDIQQIINELAAASIAAEFGVGEFKDYPTPPYGSGADVPYRLLRRVGPVDRSLVEAIEALQAGGGGDIPESAFTGLFQAATGLGDGSVVPPGQDAGFRPGALRVIVNVTDARFHAESDYPGPGLNETVAALRRRSVRQVGLSVGGGGRSDLEDVAVATRAFAPADGLDCDGDGDKDLPGGAPLVCDVGDSEGLLPVGNPADGLLGDTPVRIAPAIVGLLRSVRDEAAVELQTQRDRLARVIGRNRVERVDAKQDRVLRFVVRYSCPPTGLAEDAIVPLRAVSREAVIARASAVLRCPPPPTVPLLDRLDLPPRATAPLAALVVLVPPLPPPAPVSQGQPDPQSNSQPESQAQAQAQAQPQVGVVAEEQDEVQVAAVEVPAEGRGVQELAMSDGRRADDDVAVVALGLAAVAMCGAATMFAARRRTAGTSVPVR